MEQWRLIFLFLLLPSFLLSGEFVASVSRNPINVNESFTLTLTLKDASARGSPSITPLKNSFYINSQQQSLNTTVREWACLFEPHLENQSDSSKRR